MQHTQNKYNTGLNVLSDEARRLLLQTLSTIISQQSDDDDILFSTSTVEYAIAALLRDNVENILSSGVDPFDEVEALNNQEESKEIKANPNLRCRKSMGNIKKQNTSKMAKYSKQLLEEANKKKKISKSPRSKKMK